MRILKVHNYYLQPGGEDTVFESETALLRSRGNEVDEYVDRNDRIESMNTASVVLQTLWSTSSQDRLRATLLDVRPEVVHFHNTFPLISPAAYYVCSELGIPVVQTLDNQRLICPAASFYRDGKLCLDCVGQTPPWPGVVHACYHDSHLHTAVVASMLTLHRWLGTWQTKIDTFLCSTRFYRDLFVEAGLPEEKIVVMPHFVQHQDPPDPSRNPGNYALYLGRLDPEKGIRTLLQAWRGIDIPLKIRGAGRLEVEARQFAATHDLDTIEFVGRLEDAELSSLIRNASFLVVPSEGYYETFGMVIVEAYARGVPVVASNIGVIPELVSDHETGLLFEAGNPMDLAEKVNWMWGHPEEGKVMGQLGLGRYRERFTPDQCYETLMGVYEKLVGEGA